MQIETTDIIAWLPGEPRFLGKRGEQYGFLSLDRDQTWKWTEIEPTRAVSAMSKYWYIPVPGGHVTINDTNTLAELVPDWNAQLEAIMDGFVDEYDEEDDL
jgi:hypothetical protein